MATFRDFSHLGARRKDDRGAVLILTSLVMLLILFIAAFATDLGAWYRQGQQQQQAADVASLNSIQAYDRVVQEQFGLLGVASWNEITDVDDRAWIEELALIEVLNTVQGILETSGLSFTLNGHVLEQIAPPPNVLGDESIISIVADDGTTIRIVRSVEITPDGREVSAISVSISDEGEQFFSSLLRDAPNITRTSTSVLSNCGAICNQVFPISPPFTGFNSAGEGDGWKPLPFNSDGVEFNGPDEIWAINHHVHAGSPGRIVCMTASTGTPCKSDGTQFAFADVFPTGETSGRPNEIVHTNRGIILLPGRDASTGDVGLLCWDAAERGFCDDRLHGLFTIPGVTRTSADVLPVAGPVTAADIDDRNASGDYYLFDQSGGWYCVRVTDVPNETTGAPTGGTTTMANCPTASGTTSLTGAPAIPDADAPPGGRERPLAFHDDNTDHVYFRSKNTQDDLLFYCFDLQTQSECWSSFAMIENWGSQELTRDLTFFGRDTNGTPDRICVYRAGQINRCLNLSDGSLNGPIPGFFNASKQWARANSLLGHADYWSNTVEGVTYHRTFFSGGNNNTIGCWDWNTGSCGFVVTNTAFTGQTPNGITPYSLTQVSPNCLVGLSHHSVFFSLNPVSLGICSDTQTRQEIEPCRCADGENVWGLIVLPPELLEVAESIDVTFQEQGSGTILQPNGTTHIPFTRVYERGNPSLTGVIDLTSVPDTVPRLIMTLEVDARTDPAAPRFDRDIDVEIDIISQPTLVG